MTPGQFPRMLQSAIQTAITRKGVAVVGLPGDLAKASSVSADSSVKNYPAPPEVCPAEEDLAQLADLLNNHKRITLFLRHRLSGSTRGSNRAFRETECPCGIYFQRKNGSTI